LISSIIHGVAWRVAQSLNIITLNTYLTFVKIMFRMVSRPLPGFSIILIVFIEWLDNIDRSTLCTVDFFIVSLRTVYGFILVVKCVVCALKQQNLRFHRFCFYNRDKNIYWYIRRPNHHWKSYFVSFNVFQLFDAKIYHFWVSKYDQLSEIYEGDTPPLFCTQYSGGLRRYAVRKGSVRSTQKFCYIVRKHKFVL